MYYGDNLGHYSVLCSHSQTHKNFVFKASVHGGELSCIVAEKACNIGWRHHKVKEKGGQDLEKVRKFSKGSHLQRERAQSFLKMHLAEWVDHVNPMSCCLRRSLCLRFLWEECLQWIRKPGRFSNGNKITRSRGPGLAPLSSSLACPPLPNNT